MPITEQPELLPITIQGQTFHANTDGMWSLNAIHQTLGLPEAKRPGQWNNEIRIALDQDGNFHLAYGGANPGTWATEAGTIAYAMWVSPAFYLMVVRAFILMRNDSVLQKRVALLALDESNGKLTTAIPKADLIDSRLRPGGPGVTWADACKMASVGAPVKALRHLHDIGKMTRERDDWGVPTGSIKPIQDAFKWGFFKLTEYARGNKEGWRVTAKGLAWLQGKAQGINEAIAEQARQKATMARAAKASKVNRWGRVQKDPPL